MATTFSISEEDMEIDEGLGYPKAYAKLCRNPHLFNAYNQGPPFAYSPYILHSQEVKIVFLFLGFLSFGFGSVFRGEMALQLEDVCS